MAPDPRARIAKINASELKEPLERIENPHYQDRFGYAVIVRTALTPKPTFQKVGDKQPNAPDKDKIDVLSWSRTEEAARATAEYYNGLFIGEKEAIIVDLAR